MTENRTYKTCSDEFKKEAVVLVTEQGYLLHALLQLN